VIIDAATLMPLQSQSLGVLLFLALRAQLLVAELKNCD
jgi:hypothetical protein